MNYIIYAVIVSVILSFTGTFLLKFKPEEYEQQ